MASSPVLLILGAGPKVGSHAAKVFATKGYRVALASRSLQDSSGSDDKELHINADLSKPETVPTVFQKVKKAFGTGPNVVVYNGAAAHLGPPHDPLAKFNLEEFTNDMNVNSISVAAAAKEAVNAFRELDISSKRTFIMVGNVLAITSIPQFATFGMGKGAAANLMNSLRKGYADEGFRFYFADERSPEGKPVSSTDGPTHADVFLKLAETAQQEPWYYTFVKGENGAYKDFGLELS